MSENSTLKDEHISVKFLSDSEVIEQVLQGQIEMFEILMRRNNQLLYRTIRSYIDIDADVQDTMQDVYVKAFQKLHQFHNDALFSTWLVRIGINQALEHKRKSKKHVTVNIFKEIGTLQIADTETMNPENKTIYLESSAFIEAAIDALPHKYKIVFMLKEVEGLEISEIAKILNLSSSNVKVRLHRARNMMKEFLLRATNAKDLFEFGNARCDKLVEKVLVSIRNLSEVD